MNSYSEIFKVRNYEMDSKGFLKIPSLFNYLQEIASNHAEKLGWGFDSMAEKGILWVLSRLQIEILEIPKWGDELTVMTFPKGLKKLYAVRDYVILNSAGKEMIKSSSGWLVINSETFRPQNPEPIVRNFILENSSNEIDLFTEKIEPYDKIINSYSRKVSPNDIDINQHTNNARYAEWIIDSFDYEFLREHTLKKIFLSYLNQTVFGDEVQIVLSSNKSDSPNSKFVSEITLNNSSNSKNIGKKVLSSYLEWI